MMKRGHQVAPKTKQKTRTYRPANPWSVLAPWSDRAPRIGRHSECYRVGFCNGLLFPGAEIEVGPRLDSVPQSFHLSIGHK